MDQGRHGIGVDTATRRPHRRGSPHRGRHSFRVPGDRRGGRVSGRPECRRGDGHRGEFRDRRERDRAAEALQGEAAAGADAEEHRHVRRLYPRAGAHVFPARGDRPEGRALADDARFPSYRCRHPDPALSSSAAGFPLQVTTEGEGISAPFLNLNSRLDSLIEIESSENSLRDYFNTARSPIANVAFFVRLLLAEEDNELGIRISPDRESESERRESGTDNVGYDNGDKQDRNAAPLFSEVNSIYAYQEPDEDVELFVSPAAQAESKWKQELRVARYFRFWAAVVTWIGMRAGSLFFWILVPALSLKRTQLVHRTDDWVTLLVIAGVGSFVPSVASYWSIVTTVQYRRIYFGAACWLGSFVLFSA